MTRYLPSKQYQYAGVAATALALVCAGIAVQWPLAWVPVGLFLATGSLMLLLASQPAIEISEAHLGIGDRILGWDEIRRIDRTGFVSPLIVYLTLSTGRRLLVVYPGGLEDANTLLRQMRRLCTEALIDGIPYRQFWGEAISASPSAGTPGTSSAAESASAAPEKRALASPKYQMLRPEDEAEVERLYQRLKSVGHLDRSDEK